MVKSSTIGYSEVRFAMPGCGKFSLTINQVNFTIKSLFGGDSITGACAFISLACQDGFLPASPIND
jgi:hypothetical protein